MWRATLIAASLLVAGEAQALRVVAATNDLGAIARAVVGEDLQLDVVARPDRDPHALEVRPSALRITGRADVYLAVGLSLDLWSAEIVRGSRNRNLAIVDCGGMVTTLEVPTGKVDASQGDVHPEGNPHYWLDPRRGVQLAHRLAERFAQLDPEHAERFRENAIRFEGMVEARLGDWIAAMQGASIVEYHRTWVYFAERFEVEIAGRVEPLPGIPPSARHLADLAERIRRLRVPLVVADVYHPDGPLEFLERETGVEVVRVAASCAEPTPEAYLGTFDRMADALGRRK